MAAPRAKSWSAKSSTGKALTSSRVFCRVRPFAAQGGHAHTEDVDQKTLERWDRTSVTIATEYMFSKSASSYTFPRHVLGPEAQQREVYETLMPDFLDAFIGDMAEPRNVLFLAYGQTGTGKTHTMFGTDESLTGGGGNGEDPEGWGLFPRAASEVLRRMAGKKFVLTGSAVEFYLMGCSDLLAAGKPLVIEQEKQMPCGCVQQELRSAEEVLQFLATARANRKSRSTRMNVAERGHEGSSRSHAALILQLLQLGEDGKCLRTSFSLFDLAGAERPGKTGEARVTGYEAYVQAISGQELDIGAQGTMINYELHMVRSSIVRACNAHAKGLRYMPEMSLTTSMLKVLTGAFAGNAMLGMLVCLSPSGANGWETWFSLEYGKDMARLRVPLRSEAREEAGKRLARLETRAAEAMEALRKTPKSGAPASRFYGARLGTALGLVQHSLDLARLCGDAGAAGRAEAHWAQLQLHDAVGLVA